MNHCGLALHQKRKRKKKLVRLSTATYVNWLHVCTDLLYHWGVHFDKNNFRRHLSTCDKTLYLSSFASLVKLNIKKQVKVWAQKVKCVPRKLGNLS